MKFTYTAFNRGNFMSTMHEIGQENKLTTIGQIDFNQDPEDELKEIASVQDNVIAKLTETQLTRLKSIN